MLVCLPHRLAGIVILAIMEQPGFPSKQDERLRARSARNSELQAEGVRDSGNTTRGVFERHHFGRDGVPLVLSVWSLPIRIAVCVSWQTAECIYLALVSCGIASSCVCGGVVGLIASAITVAASDG